MTMTRTTLHACLLGLALAMGGCDDSDPQETGADTDDSGETEDSGDMCDPVGAQPEQAALFNAPVEADVEVIQKVPTHPGAPGPTDLP
ncbi:MAG: hypothetical protein ACRBN8_05080 [Nannocystales bacterium]